MCFALITGCNVVIAKLVLGKEVRTQAEHCLVMSRRFN